MRRILTATAGGSLSNSCDLVSDTNVYSIQQVSKPGYLQSYIDPIFHTQITRITGDPGTAITTANGTSIGTWGAVAHHDYSKVQAWNADQSLLFIETNREGGTGGLFLDGQTYQPLFTVANRPYSGGEVRWHPTNPDLMIYAVDNVLGSWDPRQNINTTIATFDIGGLLLGPFEGNLTLDGNVVVLTQRDDVSPAHYVFAYDMSTHTKYPTIDTTNWQSGYTTGWVSISPKGTYIVLNYTNPTTDGKIVILDLQGNLVLTFPYSGHPSHADMTLDENNEEVIVGRAAGSPSGGRIIRVRLRDADMSILTSGGYGQHTSTRAFRTWGASTMVETTNYPPYNAEILVYNLNGSKVFRVGQTHNVTTDNAAEAIPSFSPDGLRVLFASNWGSADGRPVQTYVIDLHPNCALR